MRGLSICLILMDLGVDTSVVSAGLGFDSIS